jgi:hypothetical protein
LLAGKEISLFSIASRPAVGHPVGTGGFFPRGKAMDTKLTTHLLAVLRLGMILSYVFMQQCTGMTSL